MSEELKPCPFCGSKTDPALSVWENDCGEPDAGGGFHVICCAVYRNQDPFGGCGASTGWNETEAEAIAAWNRRA